MMAGIKSAVPKDDYTLEVMMTNQNRLLCNMKPYLETIQFCPLKDMETWKQIEVTDTGLSWNGISKVELSMDSLLDLFRKDKNQNRDSRIDKTDSSQEWFLHVVLENTNWMDIDFRQLIQYPLFSPLMEKGLRKTIQSKDHSLLWKNNDVSLEISIHTVLNYFI